MTYNWSNFTRKVFINAPISKLFDAWSKSDEIVKWFIKTCEYRNQSGEIRNGDKISKTGDTYYWKWHQDLEAKGRILNVIEDELFEFTFGSVDKNNDVVVTVKFGSEDGDNYMLLTQRNNADHTWDNASYHLSCNLGWSFFMTNMKALMEHGVDLREYDETRAYETRAVSL